MDVVVRQNPMQDFNPVLSTNLAANMSVQNRSWNFGSDGSFPIEGATRAGFTGQFLGENIAETFETETETLSAWMKKTVDISVVARHFL